MSKITITIDDQPQNILASDVVRHIADTYKHQKKSNI